MHGKQLKAGTVDKSKILATPASNDNEYVTLSQMNSALANRDFGENIRVTSSSNINVSSPGASIDGVALAVDDRVLLINQTNGAENGPWVWKGASVTMVRPTDGVTGAISVGRTYYIAEGVTNKEKSYTLKTTGVITVGSTVQTWIIANNVIYATPTTANKNMPALTTTVDGDKACNTAITYAPALGSYIEVLVNGRAYTVGNGTKSNVPCYFSADGTTARSFSQIVAGDFLYWNGSVAGFQLSITDADVIDFNYSV